MWRRTRGKRFPPRPTVPAGPVGITPGNDHLGCAADVAWSPDSTQVAVIGDQVCGYYPHQTVADIYSASTGQLSIQIAPDNAIDRALTAAAPGSVGTSTIYLRHTIWSRDGANLYITFIVNNDAIADPVAAFTEVGLVVAHIQTRQLTVYLHPDTVGGNAVALWNLQDGAATVLPPVPRAAMARCWPQSLRRCGFAGTSAARPLRFLLTSHSRAPRSPRQMLPTRPAIPLAIPHSPSGSRVWQHW